MQTVPKLRPAAVTLSLALLLIACNSSETDQGGELKAAQSPGVSLFTEIAAEAGLSFEHDNGADGSYYFPEINGAGCALLDYDGDRDLDGYLVQGVQSLPCLP